MNILTAVLSGLLLAPLMIATASASGYHFNQVLIKMNLISILNSAINSFLIIKKTNPGQARSATSRFPDKSDTSLVWHNCADLFESLYEQFQESGTDHEHPNFFPKAYYDFILDDQGHCYGKSKD